MASPVGKKAIVSGAMRAKAPCAEGDGYAEQGGLWDRPGTTSQSTLNILIFILRPLESHGMAVI